MKKYIVFFILGLFFLAAPVFAQSLEELEAQRQAWLANIEQLKTQSQQNYNNMVNGYNNRIQNLQNQKQSLQNQENSLRIEENQLQNDLNATTQTLNEKTKVGAFPRSLKFSGVLFPPVLLRMVF